MSKVEELLDAIGSLTVLEAAELKEMMEDKFGVTAAAPVAMAVGGAMPGAGDAAAEEQTEAIAIRSHGLPELPPFRGAR